MLDLKYLQALWILFSKKWFVHLRSSKKKKRETFLRIIQESTENEIPVHSDLYVPGHSLL